MIILHQFGWLWFWRYQEVCILTLCQTNCIMRAWKPKIVKFGNREPRQLRSREPRGKDLIGKIFCRKKRKMLKTCCWWWATWSAWRYSWWRRARWSPCFLCLAANSLSETIFIIYFFFNFDFFWLSIHFLLNYDSTLTEFYTLFHTLIWIVLIYIWYRNKGTLCLLLNQKRSKIIHKYSVEQCR